MVGTLVTLTMLTVLLGICAFGGIVIGTVVGLFKFMFAVFFIILAACVIKAWIDQGSNYS